MESKERIMELLRGISGDNCFGSVEKIAEYLVENGVIAPPCKVGDTVFTIEENYFDCENCEHRDEARLDPQQGRLSCEFPEDRHCPYFIKEHVAEGFNVDSGGISGPGEWGYEGLERFTGIDAGWYPTREDAAAAKAALEAHHV